MSRIFFLSWTSIQFHSWEGITKDCCYISNITDVYWDKYVGSSKVHVFLCFSIAFMKIHKGLSNWLNFKLNSYYLRLLLNIVFHKRITDLRPKKYSDIYCCTYLFFPMIKSFIYSKLGVKFLLLSSLSLWFYYYLTLSSCAFNLLYKHVHHAVIISKKLTMKWFLYIYIPKKIKTLFPQIQNFTYD